MKYLLHGNSKVVYITVLIYILYSLQGTLYPSGGVISQSLMLIYLVIGLTHFMLIFLKKRYNVPILMASLFVLLNVLYYIFNNEVNNSVAYQQIKGVLACFTPFVVSFYYTHKNKFNESIFCCLSVILFLVYLLSFNRMDNVLVDQNGASDAIVNNVSYSFTRIIPLIFYLNTKLLYAMILLFLTNFYVIIGAKRGAAISAILGDLGYFFYISNMPHKSNIIQKFLIICMVIIFCFSVFYLLDSNTFLMRRFFEGDSSNRDYIYMSIWNWWTAPDTKLINFLFGGGLVSSINITGGSLAHNDWLEVLSNFGLLGLITYGIFLISITIKVFSNKIIKDKISGLVIVLMWWTTSMTSTWYNTPENFPVMLLLGFLIGRNYSQNQNRKVSILNNK